MPHPLEARQDRKTRAGCHIPFCRAGVRANSPRLNRFRTHHADAGIPRWAAEAAGRARVRARCRRLPRCWCPWTQEMCNSTRAHSAVASLRSMRRAWAFSPLRASQPDLAVDCVPDCHPSGRSDRESAAASPGCKLCFPAGSSRLSGKPGVCKRVWDWRSGLLEEPAMLPALEWTGLVVAAGTRPEHSRLASQSASKI